VHDRYAYPLVAFRELIANALIHRDLDGWSAGLAIEVRLRRDRLVITNPGGLYGITVDQLGRDSVTSAASHRYKASGLVLTAPGQRAVVPRARAPRLPAGHVSVSRVTGGRG
jgi:ATP-dependent DNA helicase RecG